jgi:hypothetical protein
MALRQLERYRKWFQTYVQYSANYVSLALTEREDIIAQQVVE